MKKNISLIISIILSLTLMNCSQKKITDLRGKVNYDYLHLVPKVTGRVKEIKVDEGQIVKKGDTLIVLDVPELSAKKMQAQGAVKAAKAQLQMAYNGATIEQVNQIDGKLEAAQSQLEFAKESFERMENMYKDSLVPSQKYDEVKMKYKMAQAQVKAIKAKKKEVLRGTRKEVIAQAKGQLERALGALKEVETAEKEQYIIAPDSFRVDKISLKKGELATAGYTLISGILPQSVYFRFTIPEHKIQDFQVNQTVQIVNPYTKQTVSGKILKIEPLSHYADITSPATSYKLGETVYEMKLIPNDKTKAMEWKKNMTVLMQNK